MIQVAMEKPHGFNYTAVQAVEVTLDDSKFKEDWAPSTLTGFNKNDNLEL